MNKDNPNQKKEKSYKKREVIKLIEALYIEDDNAVERNPQTKRYPYLPRLIVRRDHEFDPENKKDVLIYAKGIFPELPTTFPENMVNICKCSKKTATIDLDEIQGRILGNSPMATNGGSNGELDYFTSFENFVLPKKFRALRESNECNYSSVIRAENEIDIFILDTHFDCKSLSTEINESIKANTGYIKANKLLIENISILNDACSSTNHKFYDHGTGVVKVLLEELIRRNNVYNTINIHVLNVTELIKDRNNNEYLVVPASKLICALDKVEALVKPDKPTYINLSLGFIQKIPIVEEILVKLLDKNTDLEIFCSAGNLGWDLASVYHYNFPSNMTLDFKRVHEIYGSMVSDEGLTIWNDLPRYSSNVRGISPIVNETQNFYEACYNPSDSNKGGTSFACPRALASKLKKNLPVSS